MSSLEPPPSAQLDEGRRFWSGGVAAFARAEWRDSFYARRAAEVARLLGDLAPDARVLDVGCGSGLLAATVARGGRRVTALDLSPDQVDRARARCRGLPVEVRVGGLEALEGGERFDCVCAIGVLPYVVDECAFLAELAACSGPAGTVIVSRTRAATPFVVAELVRHLLRFRPGPRWRWIARNLLRTGIWSGGFQAAGPRLGTSGLDRAMALQGFARSARFGLFAVGCLDKLAGRSGAGAWLGARFGWSVVLVYRRP